MDELFLKKDLMPSGSYTYAVFRNLATKKQFRYALVAVSLRILRRWGFTLSQSKYILSIPSHKRIKSLVEKGRRLQYGQMVVLCLIFKIFLLLRERLDDKMHRTYFRKKLHLGDKQFLTIKEYWLGTSEWDINTKLDPYVVRRVNIIAKFVHESAIFNGTQKDIPIYVRYKG